MIDCVIENCLFSGNTSGPARPRAATIGFSAADIGNTYSFGVIGMLDDRRISEFKNRNTYQCCIFYGEPGRDYSNDDFGNSRFLDCQFSLTGGGNFRSPIMFGEQFSCCAFIGDYGGNREVPPLPEGRFVIKSVGGQLVKNGM